MSSNLNSPTKLSEFWKRRARSSETQGGPSIPTLDDDYPPPPRRGNALESLLFWAGAALGVIVLLGMILILPGLVF